MEPKSISILGATGSVGQSTVDLMLRNPDSFRIVALTANGNAELLAKQAKALKAERAVVADPKAYTALREALAGTDIEAAAGPQAVSEAAAMDSDLVMAAILGAAGLSPTLAAVRRGTTVVFANKECLVTAGTIMMREVAAHGATLLPVDSEHNAIFQVFETANREAITRLVITASGGPFRTWSMGEMSNATPEQAVAHPNWSMGAKISVDSATMMNKGLEVIEASYLFDMADDRIDVVVHPQSVVHSLVEYADGSMLAQLGSPDMRTPIAHALAWPERMAAPTERLDLVALSQLDFEAPDSTRFPALNLCRDALKAGGYAPPVLNAANEVAVARFLRREIGFLDIAAVVEETVTRFEPCALSSLDDVFSVDTDARRLAEECVGRRVSALVNTA